ncbi:hypothetical protein, partial [Flavobacterium branchiarum]
DFWIFGFLDFWIFGFLDFWIFVKPTVLQKSTLSQLLLANADLVRVSDFSKFNLYCLNLACLTI